MALNPSNLGSKALSYLVRRKSRNETQDAGFLEMNSYHNSSLCRVVAMATLSCLPPTDLGNIVLSCVIIGTIWQCRVSHHSHFIDEEREAQGG